MIIKTLLKGLSTSILLSAAFFSNADQYTISFDDVSGVHGTVLNNQYNGTFGDLDLDVTFWAQEDWNDSPASLSSTNADLFLTLFDSDLSGTKDPDLEVDKGNIAIIHERNGDCTTTTTCTDPDDRYTGNVSDETNQHTVRGGFMFVEFSQPVSVHSIGLADIESSASQRGQFAFINSAGSFLGYTDMIVTGDITKNDGGSGYGVQNTTQVSAGDTVSYIVFKMVGSGGINDITISRNTTSTSVPEPASIAILGFGLLMMGRFRKG